MRKLKIKIAVVLIAALSAAANVRALETVAFRYGESAELISCYDGDTCRLRWDGEVHKVRIVGVDAPEMGERAKCKKELRKAIRARDLLLKTLRAAKTITVEPIGFDKYKRTLAFVYADGKNVVPLLIRKKLATPYGARGRWC